VEHNQISPKTKTRRYWILRFWRPKDNEVKYARDSSGGRRHRREWYATHDLRLAYEFQSRADARQAVRAKAFEDLVKGVWRQGSNMRGYERKSGYDTDNIYFWEVVQINETITTTFDVRIDVSNAPDMIQIARAAS